MYGNKRSKVRKLRKKAYIFTLDAFLASIILIGGLILISQFLSKEHPKESTEYLTTDLLNAMAEIKVAELNATFVSTYLSGSNHTNANLSVLEQVGTYWAAGEQSYALNLTNYLASGLFNNNTGAEISLGSLILYRKNIDKNTDVYAGDRMITGVLEGAPITGSTSSAYLRRINDKRTSSFAYFGGFSGQGNLSIVLRGIPSDVAPEDISQITLELDAGDDFTLYVNSNVCGSFSPTAGNLTPDSWDITHCNASFQPGDNNISVVFLDMIEDAYIAGGFVRVDYKTDLLQEDLSIGQMRYYFPEIEGVANLYDSFYIPGTLTNLSVMLHYDSKSKTYLDIGSVTVHQNPANGETTILLTDANLTNFPVNLNYETISNKTVPLRFASYNETYSYVFGSNSDVVLITDLSGSMKYRMNAWDNPGNAIPNCKQEDISDESSRRLGVAACLDSQVNAIVMNSSVTNNSNRLWLVDFADNANPFYNPSLPLLTEANIENEISTRYKSKSQQEIKGGTCLCCAINQAYEILNAYSNDNRTKSVIVMSDGVPTFCCGGYMDAGVWTCNETSTGLNKAWPAVGQATSCEGDEADCTGTRCQGPQNNAINSAKRLYDELNATIYGIGFGPLENCTNANYTIAEIAKAGNGTYFVGRDGLLLQEFYRNISFDIISKVTQSSQLVSIEGNITPSTLFGDSYIDFTYIPMLEPPQPNEISVAVQTQQFNSCSPTITIPAGLRVADAKITSYSDYHWTDYLAIDGVEVYNLSKYSLEYIRLGDPYQIQVPTNLLVPGPHILTVRTADSPINITGCSMNNTLIYTALVPSATSRSGVVEKIEGCTWTIQFEDDTFSTKSIPGTYAGLKNCYYTVQNHSFSQGSYDRDDAYDVAVFNLLRTLDFDNNGKVFVNLDSEDIEIVITTISSVPYLWGPSIVKVKVWQ